MTRRRRPRTSEERLVAAVGSVARGVVGGRIRNVRQAAPLERNTGSVATGGFDPNADPIVIGNAATAPSGSFSGVVVGRAAESAHGDASVAVGGQAQSLEAYQVVIGYQATASTSGDVCIGNGAGAGTGDTTGTVGGATAVGQGAYATTTGTAASAAPTALGLNALALNDSSIAIGVAAQGRAIDSIAVGRAAYVDVAHTQSTALGADAVTTAAHQIMLGTTTEFVEVPGNGVVLHDSGGTRWRITVTTGGSLTVAAA